MQCHVVHRNAMCNAMHLGGCWWVHVICWWLVGEGLHCKASSLNLWCFHTRVKNLSWILEALLWATQHPLKTSFQCLDIFKPVSARAPANIPAISLHFGLQIAVITAARGRQATSGGIGKKRQMPCTKLRFKASPANKLAIKEFPVCKNYAKCSLEIKHLNGIDQQVSVPFETSVAIMYEYQNADCRLVRSINNMHIQVNKIRTGDWCCLQRQLYISFRHATTLLQVMQAAHCWCLSWKESEIGCTVIWLWYE